MTKEREEYVFDSWEELENNEEFDRRLNCLQRTDDRPKKQIDGVMPILQDGCSRTQYSPQVKILKRTTDSSSPTNNGSSSPKPNKSLQQREAEYAKARARILGDEYQAEVTADTDSLSMAERPTRLIQRVEELKVTNNILRQPKGPDGSNGFQRKS